MANKFIQRLALAALPVLPACIEMDKAPDTAEVCAEATEEASAVVLAELAKWYAACTSGALCSDDRVGEQVISCEEANDLVEAALETNPSQVCEYQGPVSCGTTDTASEDCIKIETYFGCEPREDRSDTYGMGSGAPGNLHR